MEWLLAGLPQMPGDAIRAAVTKPIALAFTGPGGGSWTVEPAGDGGDAVTVVEGHRDNVAATITTSTDDFIVWATHRRPWTDFDVQVDGDEAFATNVIGAIHLF